MDKSQFWEELKSGRFVSMIKETSRGRELSNPKEVYHVLKPLFAREDDVEKFIIILLDAKNRVIEIEQLFSGSITSSAVYPREIVKRIIQKKASAFLVAHNHPSGDTEPSREDKSLTQKIGVAAACIDVHFHDHIIIGDGYHSMSESGWMQNASKQISTFLDEMGFTA